MLEEVPLLLYTNSQRIYTIMKVKLGKGYVVDFVKDEALVKMTISQFQKIHRLRLKYLNLLVDTLQDHL